MQIHAKSFRLKNQTITRYTLCTPSKMCIEILNLGGIITKVIVPDKQGHFENVVLGFEDLNEYLTNSAHLGSLIGRFAGRIYKGHITLDDIVYELPCNQNAHHLHGGALGFDTKIWKAKTHITDHACSLILTYESKHLEEGYPGNLKVNATYTLHEDHTFEITYSASTDQLTLINLTNHTYFNLSGNLKRDILDHTLTLNASKCAAIDQDAIPTGCYLETTNTPFDFRSGKKIGQDLFKDHPQIIYGNGYDHPFLLDKVDKTSQIILSDSLSGRILEIQTNQPAVVIYTQNHPVLNASRSCVFKKHQGICFETQHLPIGYDEVNKASSLLEPSKLYTWYTLWRFKTQENKAL